MRSTLGMKEKSMNMKVSNGISIASLLITVSGLVWIGGFQMSTLMHEMQDIKEDVQKLEKRMDEGFEKVDRRFEKIENRLESIEKELHQHDVRINVLEQRKR